jgi:cell division transport system permease protein
VRRLDELNLGLRRGALAIGIVVALAILFVISTTLRLTVQTRRPQVEIMSRLGATDRFIATPFVLEAVAQTGLAALVALGLMYGFSQAARLEIVGVEFLPWTWCVAFVGVTVLLTWLASLWVLSRVLRSIGP